MRHSYGLRAVLRAPRYISLIDSDRLTVLQILRAMRDQRVAGIHAAHDFYIGATFVSESHTAALDLGIAHQEYVGLAAVGPYCCFGNDRYRFRAEVFLPAFFIVF